MLNLNHIFQCSIAEQGLGPVAWWDGSAAEPVEDEQG